MKGGRSIFDGLFDEDGLLGAVRGAAGYGITGPGKHVGKWRPGRRSTEKKLLAAKANLAELTRMRDDALKNIRRAPDGQLVDPKTGKTVATIAVTDAKTGKKVTVVGPPPAGKRPPVAVAGKTAQKALQIKNMMMGAFGDAPAPPADPTAQPAAPPADPTQVDPQPGYTGNGHVWLSDQSIPLYWGVPKDPHSSNGRAYDKNGNPLRPIPITYPDGSQVTGRIWLPMLDLTAAGYQNFTRVALLSQASAQNVNDVAAQHRAEGYDVIWSSYGGNPTPSKLEHVNAWPGYYAKGSHQVLAGQKNPYQGNREPWGPLASQDSNGRDDWFMLCNFDWSLRDPTSQAYPWIYDNLTPDSSQLMTWEATPMPADLWLSNGTPITGAAGYYLPPIPFLCLDFLDALSTGSHGLPQVIDSQGRLDMGKFRQWAGNDPQWQQALQTNQPWILATIYDVTDVVGPNNKVTTANTPPSPPPPPTNSTPPDTGAPTAPIAPTDAGTPPGYMPTGSGDYYAPPGYMPTGSGDYYASPDQSFTTDIPMDYIPSPAGIPPDQIPPSGAFAPADDLPPAADIYFDQAAPTAEDDFSTADDFSQASVDDFGQSLDDWSNSDDGGF